MSLHHPRPPITEPQPNEIMATWNRWHRYPGGRWLLSRIIGWRIPFTGKTYPLIEHMAPGEGRVSMKDRRSVRNHLRSIHFGAIATFAEFPSAIAMLAAAPPGIRYIMVELSIQFVKKARGRITASCQFDPALVVEVTEPRDLPLNVDVVNASGERVAQARYVWRIAPKTTTTA